ncbi:MAG: STAS domain-containing protein [Tepidisphaeraceae bacterium]
MTTNHTIARDRAEGADQQLSVDVVETPRGVVARIAGEVGMMTAERLGQELKRLSTRLTGDAKSPLVVLDLAGVPLIVSIGMGALVGFRKTLRATGRQVKLAAVQPHVLESLKLARLHKLFEIRSSVDEALEPDVA